MKIGIASDHQGFERKKQILNYLRSKNFDVIDLGTDSKENTDYIDYCVKLCNNINEKKIDYGILICLTGIGMSMCANKIDGILCAKPATKKEAILSRKHNDANVIAFSKNMPYRKTIKLLDAFLHTPFLEEERYIRRIKKLKNIEKGSKNN